MKANHQLLQCENILSFFQYINVITYIIVLRYLKGNIPLNEICILRYLNFEKRLNGVIYVNNIICETYLNA